MTNTKGLILIFAMIALLAGFACTPKAEEQTKEATQEVKDKAKEIGEATKNKAKEIAEATKDKTKEIAGEVADRSKQVLSVTGEAITDGWITTKIKAKFADDKLLKDSKITVETDNRVVTLRGAVGSAAANEHAKTIASGTEGVGNVIDELVVKSK